MLQRLHSFKTLSAFGAGVLFVYSVSANAASDEEPQDLLSLPLEELLNIEIRTPSKRLEKIADTPATVIVINQRQIEQRRYISLIDLLQDLPSVDVQRKNEETRYHDITFRGHLGNNKFLILQDGVRIDSPSGELIPVAENYPLHHVEQVEVLYGPAAALYGADAFAGVINLITRNPADHAGARLNMSLGGDGYRYYSAQLAHQFPHEVNFSLAAHVHQSDTPDLAAAYPDAYAPVDAVTFGGDVVVPAAQREAYNAAVKSHSINALVTVGEAWRFGFNRSFFRSQTSTGVRPSKAIFAEEAHWNTLLNTFYGEYKTDMTEKLHSETTLSYSTYEADPDSKFKNIFVDFQDAYKYAEGSKFAVEQQFSYAWDDTHYVIGGLVYEDYYSLPKTPDLSHPLDPDGDFASQGFYYGGTDNTLPMQFLDISYRNYAGYIQLQSSWRPSLSSVIGLRYDKNSRYSGTLNPRLGVIYKPAKASVVKLMYGESFRAPSGADSLAHYGTFSGEQNADGQYLSSFFRAPNLNLEPEKASTLEASFSHAFQKNFTVAGSLYFTDLSDLIMAQDNDPAVQFIPGGLISRTNSNQNLGTGRYWGGDVRFDYRQRLGSWETEWWGSYSYIDGYLTNSGGTRVDVPYIARHKFKLGSTFSYHKKYFLTALFQLIGPTATNLRADDAGALVKAPGYGVVNLHLGAKDIAETGFNLYLDVYNLFDRRYYNAGGVTSSATFVNAPQDPRRIMLSIGYAF